MDDNTRAALDAEAPVNPYSLLDALNAAARRTNGLWWVFLSVMAYLALTVASVTHRDLLLDAGAVLPLLQVRIGLAGFFLAAPAVLVLLHLKVMAQFALLTRKALEFDNALRLLETTELRSHPLRLELDSFFFVQGLAGPERSRVVSALLHAASWLTLLILPLLLLLWMQLAVLPLHDPGLTLAQGAIVLADVVLLLLAGAFTMRAETGIFGALLRTALGNPGSAAFALAVLAGAAFVSLSAMRAGDGPLLGTFPRNMIVADANLADGIGALATRRIGLRGRDLRGARLDRVDLRQADLTGANLDGVSLRGAELSRARLGCADAAALQQPDGRARAGCTSARGADLTGARLAGASLAGADLRGARLDDAVLESADLGRGLLTGATLERARLQRADLSGASLQGASLVGANLQGAVLTAAALQMADFSGAALQGATLASAHLAGAVLRGADLEGAELQQARLYGADLRGATVLAADLAGAGVWRTAPPAADTVALADIANIALKPPSRDEIEALKMLVASLETLPAGERTAGLAGLINDLGDGGWMGSADGQTWTGLLRASEAAMAEAFRTRLAEHLGRLACHPRFADASVAAGVVRRATAPAFKGDPAGVAERLKAGDCLAARALPQPALTGLAGAAASGKGP
jgi:uncharacterized protein YjbI with pentapeptide repeats